MWWELWDLKSGNRLQEFASEESALTFVRTALRERGRATVAHWSLSAEPNVGEPSEGEALISQALTGARA